MWENKRHFDKSACDNLYRKCEQTKVLHKKSPKFLLKVSSDTTVTNCFFKDGILHGPVRKVGIKKFREFRRQLLFVGRYKNGRPSGHCWEYRDGGGFIHGCPGILRLC